MTKTAAVSSGGEARGIFKDFTHVIRTCIACHFGNLLYRKIGVGEQNFDIVYPQAVYVVVHAHAHILFENMAYIRHTAVAVLGYVAHVDILRITAV